MTDAPSHSRNLWVLATAFGPERWAVRASRVLKLSYSQIHRIAAETSPLRLRHITIVRNYLANRRGAIATETKAAKARADKAEKLARSLFSQADQRLAAIEAELRRTGS